MINVEEILRILKETRRQKVLIPGEVTSIDPLKIRLDGYSVAFQKTPNRAATYTPTVGDRVLVAVVGHSYVILCKIV